MQDEARVDRRALDQLRRVRDLRLRTRAGFLPQKKHNTSGVTPIEAEKAPAWGGDPKKPAPQHHSLITTDV